MLWPADGHSGSCRLAPNLLSRNLKQGIALHAASNAPKYARNPRPSRASSSILDQHSNWGMAGNRELSCPAVVCVATRALQQCCYFMLEARPQELDIRKLDASLRTWTVAERISEARMGRSGNHLSQVPCSRHDHLQISTTWPSAGLTGRRSKMLRRGESDRFEK